MPPETTKERRVDAGAIMALAEKLEALVVAFDRDRQAREAERREDREDRVRARQEDREHLRAWQENQEQRVHAMEQLLLQPPDGLAHQVAAATAHRHSMRFWLRTIGSSIIGILLTGLVGLWAYIKHGGR